MTDRASEQRGDALTSVVEGGVTVRKDLERTRFPIPSVSLTVRSERTDAVGIRLIEEIPAGLSLDDVGFHRAYGSEHWDRADTDAEKLAFEYVLAPGERIETVYGIRESDGGVLEALLSEPVVEIVEDTDAIAAFGDDGRGEGTEPWLEPRSRPASAPSRGTIADSLESLTERTVALRSDVNDLDDRVTGHAADIDVAIDDLTDARRRLSDLEGTVERLAAEIEASQVAESRLSEGHTAMDGRIGSVETDVEALRAEQETLRQWQRRVSEVLAAGSEASADRDPGE